MTTQTEIITASELLHMPDDGGRYELVKGELKRMAPAGHDDGGDVVAGWSVQVADLFA